MTGLLAAGGGHWTAYLGALLVLSLLAAELSKRLRILGLWRERRRADALRALAASPAEADRNLSGLVRDSIRDEIFRRATGFRVDPNLRNPLLQALYARPEVSLGMVRRGWRFLAVDPSGALVERAPLGNTLLKAYYAGLLAGLSFLFAVVLLKAAPAGLGPGPLAGLLLYAGLIAAVAVYLLREIVAINDARRICRRDRGPRPGAPEYE